MTILHTEGITMKKPFYLGAHLSAAGGPSSVFARAEAVGATAVQIFTKSNKSYFAKPLDEREIVRFKNERDRTGITQVVVHAAYLINLGSSNPDVEKKSYASLKGELERCHQLGIAYLVLHPGAHTGSGVEVCIEKIARNLSRVLREEGGSTTVLLETAAGQGTTVGRTFEEIRAIYDACDESVRSRVGVCLDTCHVFAAGYDFRTPETYNALWQSFDEVIGRQLLKVIHLNGSKLDIGCKKDRHANLDEGYIPTQSLAFFVCDERLTETLFILETPSDDGITEYKKELAQLRAYQ